MPNSIRYNSVQQTPQQSQSNLYNYQQQQHRHHHHHHHHSSHHSSPVPQIQNISSYSNHRLNTNNNSNHVHNYQTQISTPLLPLNQSSAYFLDRIDLEDYTTHTLKQTVENILSKTKSKGLKVKISLPNDGLIIDNITDPNQSWIFKTSELLYFWRDPYYLNIIIVVTVNRSRHHTNRPYSASIFRLRGTDSAQSFLQQAQQFFSNLTPTTNTSNIPNSNRNKSVEKLPRTESQVIDVYASSNTKTKPKSLSTIDEKSSSTTKMVNDRHQSPEATTAIRRVTRAEFDPGKIIAHPMDTIYNRRTYSETASSTDSHTTNSTKEILSYTKKLNDDEDDKMTTISNNLSIDQVAELMRELKELRNEIASLKLAKKMSPITRSMSTSPLAAYPEYPKKTNDPSSSSFLDITSQSEVDAETQTDFSLINHRRRQISRKNKKTMIGSGGVSTLVKKKPLESNTRNGRRTFSNSSTNTVSDQEETSQEYSAQVNDSPNDANTVLTPEQYQPVILAAPPRPVLMRNQNNFIPLNNLTSYTMLHGNQMSTEEGSLQSGISLATEKEMSKFLSANISSSNSEMIGPSMPIITTGPGTYRSLLEKSNTQTEHIYENVPILIQPNSNREAYYNIPILNADDQKEQQNQSDDYVYYTIPNNRESESQQQQQYVIAGQTISNSPPTIDSNNASEGQSSIGNIQQQKPQIISTGRHRNQPIYFANHLTNPVFNVDKQLLINTIANQFGIDLNSPHLQQLIANQHLFAARKRTFANMVWQLTPDEETALCSSPIGTQINIIDIDSTNFTARPILKAAKRFHSTSKRRGISWDSALE